MFDSVLEKTPPQRRMATGTAISIGVHAALVGIIALLTTRHEAPKEPSEPKVIFHTPRPAARLGTPEVAANAPKPSTPAKPRRPNAIVPPREIPTALPSPAIAPPVEAPGASTGERGIPEGVEGGDPTITTPGGSGNGPGTDTDPVETVQDFVAGMTRPQIPQGIFTNLYTRAAIEAQVQGMMIVRCHSMADGTLRNCRVLKGLPLLGDAVVQRLETAHITPATLAGRPTSVDYVFNLNFHLPR